MKPLLLKGILLMHLSKWQKQVQTVVYCRIVQKKRRCHCTGNVIDVMLRQKLLPAQFHAVLKDLSKKEECDSAVIQGVYAIGIPTSAYSPKYDQKEVQSRCRGEKAEKELVIGFGIYYFILYLFYLWMDNQR